MTLKEAIERVKGFELGMAIPYGQKTQDAINLLIEAGKRCQYIAEHTARWARVLLPGETEE